MRHRWSLFVAISLAASLAACGGSGGGGTATETPTDAPSVDAPAVTDPPAAAAPTEAAPGGQPAGQPAGGGEIPTIADGQWAGGAFKAEFGGSHPLSVDLPLTVGTSTTAAGFTSLFYSEGTQPDLTVVQFVLDPTTGGAFNFTSPTVLLAGGPDEGCVTTVEKNDASGIAGTFTCPEVPGMVIGTNAEARDSVTATWSAER